MQKMKVTDLIPHPKNGYFFRDIEGEAWKEFLKSIETSGIIEPIVIDQNKVIVSGHQRIRAAKELGIDEVLVDMRAFESEDEVLKALIETNIRQRGIGNPDPVLFGRCLQELERIYGLREGSRNSPGDNRIGDRNNCGHQKTQEDLAREFGISLTTMRNYKTLSSSIPEIRELVESGRISSTAALGIIRRLSESDQRAIAEQIGTGEDRVTASKVAELEKQLRMEKAARESAEVEVQQQKRAYQELQTERLSESIVEVEKVVEKVPEDYEDLKKKARLADALREDLKTEQDKYTQQQKKLIELQDELNDLKWCTKQGLDTSNLSENIYYFCTMCNAFIGNVGGLVWLTDRIADMPEKEKEMYLKAAYAFRDWALAFTQNLERSTNGKQYTEGHVGITGSVGTEA